MAKGAYVKIPKPGLYEWVYDLDLTSLYPSNIMSLNISPETKYGRILNWDSEEFIKQVDKIFEIDISMDLSAMGQFSGDGEAVIQVPNVEMRKFMDDNNLTVSANGILYKNDVKGLIPSLLELWFGERADYRAKARDADKAGNKELEQYFDRKQKIQKVLLNSLYGVLLLPIFRFYDKDNGEAVTLTGQQLIKFTTGMANYYYNDTIGTEGVDYCLYTDTDSIFYESIPLIEVLHPDYTEEEIPDLTIKVATTVQDFINKSYDMYAYKFHNVKDHKWDIKQELVSRRAFWGSAKKRYAMWLVRDGSKVVDKEDIKGFDSVRSSFPKLFRKFLKQVIIDILNDKSSGELNDAVIEFKDKLTEYNILDIMNPTSVSNIEKWRPDHDTLYKKGTPIHVKSAMNYNRLLLDQKLFSTPGIQSGDKMLWAYLTDDNPYNFDTMALLGFEDPDEAYDYVDEYINRDKLFDKAMEKKLQSIWLRS
jgi:DNA polymerase elongation subunit (family B)